MDAASACRSVLIEVLTILGKDLDKLAVVGGWVPELTFPHQGHVGSLDVDLALDPTKLKPLAYESIRKKLVDAGYRQDTDVPNRFWRRVPNAPDEIRVDIITGEFPDSAPQGARIPIQEMAVCKLRGIDLAFAFQHEVSVEGTLPEGGHNQVTARLPTISAYLCIKAIALSERKKEKDAYDIYFCVDHFPGGYRSLAAEFREKLDNPLIREGIGILRDKFARLDSIGPVWAAQVMEEATTGTGIDIETEQRRAFELVNALLNAIDDQSGRSRRSRS
jgi:hypothetical protein